MTHMWETQGPTIDEQIEGAISLFEKQGLNAWSETNY